MIINNKESIVEPPGLEGIPFKTEGTTVMTEGLFRTQIFTTKSLLQ